MWNCDGTMGDRRFDGRGLRLLPRAQGREVGMAGAACSVEAASPETVFAADPALAEPVFLVDPVAPNWALVSERAARLAMVCDGRKSVSEVAADCGAGMKTAEALSVLESLRESGILRDASESSRAQDSGRQDPDRLTELWLHINDTCNLSCVHCLLGDRRQSTRGVLPADVARRAIRQGLDLGVRQFYITGGEPLLHPEFFDLAARATEEARLTVLSNGTTIDEPIAKRLAALPRFSLQISLEAPDSATNDAVRGRGAVEKALRGIRLLIDAGLVPAVSTTLTSLNVDKLPDVTALAGRLGLKRHHVIWLHHRGKAAADTRLSVAPDRLADTMLRAREVGERVGVAVDNYCSLRSRLCAAPNTRHDLCHCAHEMLCVGSDALVYPCPVLVGEPAFAAGDLRTHPLAGIWCDSETLQRIRSLSVAVLEQCSDCDVRFLCGGGCLSQTFYETGRLDGPDPYCSAYRRMIGDELARVAAGSAAQGNGTADVYATMAAAAGGCTAQAAGHAGGRTARFHCSCTSD